MDSSLLSYEDRLWQQLFMEAQSALRDGQHDNALRDFEAALNIAEEFGTSDYRLVKSLNGLGCAYLEQKQFQQAEKLFDRALELTAKSLGPGHPESAAILVYLAIVTTNLKKLGKAEIYYTQAI